MSRTWFEVHKEDGEWVVTTLGLDYSEELSRHPTREEAEAAAREEAKANQSPPTETETKAGGLTLLVQVPLSAARRLDDPDEARRIGDLLSEFIGAPVKVVRQ